MKSHRNIPIFVPHLGCPNMCVFCNQKKISGHEKADFSSVKDEIKEALETVPADCEVQIAFFGGSFTGIDREDMIYLLETAKEFIDVGRVDSIRLSTRPDYIDEEILDILLKYKVKTIELGIQSMDDEVLLKSGRGHTAKDIERACALINSYGFELVGQMMTALPGSTPEKEIYTAKRICEMGAKGARIYPTVVFRDTELFNMMERGEYISRNMEDTVAAAADVLSVFIKNNVKVIRVGLQSSELLVSGSETASVYHESTGEFVWSRFFRNEVSEKLQKLETRGKDAVIFVPRGYVSKMTGQKRSNIIYLKEKFSLSDIKVREDENLSDFETKVILNERKQDVCD